MASVARYKFVPSMIQEQDDVFHQMLDEDLVLNGLTNETNSTERTAILEGLRNSVRRSGGRLHIQERFTLFNAIHNVLLDNDVNTRLACLNFISEVIPDFGNDLDDCMGLILPQLVVFIGHNHVSLKKLAVQTLHVYMKHSDNLQNVLNAIIQLGLQSDNIDTQTESLIALPILITPNFADEDLFLLTEALVKRIEGNSSSYNENSSITDTTSLALISLERIRNVVGKLNFEQYIQRLSPSLQSVLANAMKGGGNNERQKARKAKSATGVPLEENSPQKTKTDKATLDRCFTIAALGSKPTIDNTYEHEQYLPKGIIKKLKDSDWNLKMQGIQELSSWFEKDMKLSEFLPHLDHFFGILKELLNDSNFKVNLTSLQLVGTMIDKLGTNILPVLELLVSVLANKLGDNKNVIKQTNMHVFKKLMQNISPKKILSVLKVNIKHRNSRVREETLNVIIAALLTFPSNEFDLPMLTADVAPALIDPKRRVRHAALESFAIISQAMGHRNHQPLVSVIDDIELRFGGDGVMAAVQARFARRQLAKLNSDGLVEYAVPLPSPSSVKATSCNVQLHGADVEWVLAGGSSSDCPSSARSTPGLNDSGTNASPRRHFSAGKNRLPWENGEKASEKNPPKVKNSWGVEDKPNLKPNKNLKDGLSNDSSTMSQLSYSEKYNARKGSLNNTDPSESSNIGTTYAQLYKAKTSKSHSAGLLSSTSVKGSGLGPIVNRTNGYSLIYKKGTLGVRGKGNIDANNNPNKPLGRNNPVEATSLSPLTSHLSKSPGEKNKQNPFGINPTASLPDWSHFPNRSRRLLSPVSPSSNHDDDNLSLGEGHTYDSPIQTKPALARSASKKGRMLKSIDFSDHGSSTKISDTSSPTQLSPVPPREPISDGHHRHGGTRHSGGRNYTSLSSDFDDSPGRQHKQVGNNTWSSGSRKHDEGSVPFDKKPRIARTPVNLKRRSSTEIASEVLSSAHFSNNTQNTGKNVETNNVPQGKVHVGQTRNGSKQNENGQKDMSKEKKDMEIVGRAFDSSSDKRNNQQTLQSTLNSTSGIGSSLEESGNIGLLKNGEIGMIGDYGLSSDEKDESTQVEDFDDYEFEYEEDSECEDEARKSSGVGSNNNVRSMGLLKKYQEHVDKLDQADMSSESLYDGSDGESLEDSDDYDEDDEEDDHDDGDRVIGRSFRSGDHDRTKDQRQSLSKSTRERMESKRIEEEERIMRERQRIEELEKQNQLRLESKEQIFRDKLAKEQLEIENLIKRKEKEQELEKLKQERLQKQLEMREDAMKEEFWRSKTHIEELEKAKEAQREKEKAEKLKKLQQKKERDTIEGRLGNEVDYNEDLAIHGHHTPTRASEVVNKPPVTGASKKKASSVSQSPHQHHEKTEHGIEQLVSKRNQAMSASSSSLPTWEIPGNDLKPFSNGEAAIKTTLKLLADPEWEAKLDGLLCIRRFIRYHAHDVIAQLHVIILAVVAEVKNLRSQVSRAAIFTLGEMFTCLEKHMDLDLETTTNVLLKKAGESNHFIRSDGERALGCLVSSVTASKAIAALVTGGSGHRNVNIRKTAAQFLCMLAERMGPARCLNGSKDITERIIIAAAAFASDAGDVTRYYGRRILHMLDNHEDFERMLQKYLPAKSLNPTLIIVENLRTKGLCDIPSDVSSARARKAPTNSGVGSRSSSMVSSTTDGAATSSVSNVVSTHSATSREGSRRHQRRVPHEATSPQDQEDMAALAQQFASNDWKDRMQAIDRLMELTETRLTFVISNLVKILDGFTPRLTDNNSKVNLYALQSLLKIIPPLKDNLNGCIATIVPAVAKNLASKNMNLVDIAEEVLDCLIKHIDNIRLIQPLCQFINVAPGGPRSRPSAITKLLAVVTDVYPRKSSIVVKHVLPVLWTLLGSASSASTASGNTKSALNSLSQLLYSLMGESLFEYAAAKSQRFAQKLKEIVSA